MRSLRHCPGSPRFVLASSVLGVLLVGLPADSHAQATRGFVVVNGGYQVTTNDFADSAVKHENAEDGRLDTTYVLKGGPAFDVAVTRTFSTRFGRPRVSAARGWGWR